MSTADDLVRAHQPPPYTATVRALISAHRLTDRMLVMLLAISRGEVDGDGRWLGWDLRRSVKSLWALRDRGLAHRHYGALRWELTDQGRRVVDQLGGAR